MRPSHATARSDASPSRAGAPPLRVFVSEPEATARATAGARLRACRPRQWLKNLLVVIAPAAAGVLTRPAVLADVAGALAAFCLLSSATYLVNDVRDREEDRRHPRKRHRPVAAGELSCPSALRMAAVIGSLGIVLAVVISPGLGVLALCYLLLTTSYSMLWRHVVVADIVVVSGGFVVRATAGGAAAAVPLSRSFLVVTSACALFLVAGKRYADLNDGASRSSRATLRRYSRPLLSRLLVGTALIGCAAYARWAFTRPQFGPWFELSLLPFAMWLARYGMRLRAGEGQAPEDLILHDWALLALGAVWSLLFIAGVYGPL